MKKKPQLKVTEMPELVETHNILLSLKRLQGQPYDTERWKRSLYHAAAMAQLDNNQVEKLRLALSLP